MVVTSSKICAYASHDKKNWVIGGGGGTAAPHAADMRYYCPADPW
jgi:hypothetical protein